MINKTKAEIAKEIAQKEAVKKQKILAKKIFEIIKDQKSIYDAQTVLTAVSGYIKYEIQVKESGVKVSDLIFDLKNQKKSDIKTSMEALLNLLQTENAIDMANFLERFGKTLAHYSSETFMKNPMSSIKEKDIIA